MPNYRRHHGISMVGSEYIENMNVERLDADPSPIVAGRVWYNNTDRVMRFSSLDGNGGIEVQTIVTDADFQVLQATVDVINGDSSTAGSFRQVIGDVVGTAPAALDTLVEIAASLNNDPNLASTLTTLVATSIEDLDQKILGTATTAMDTLQEVEAAINAINTVVGDLTTLVTVEKSNLVGAINEVAASASQNASDVANLVSTVTTGLSDAQVALDAEVQSITNDIGDLATLDTTATGSLVAAVNELKAEAGAGAAALRDNLNARVFTYDSATPLALHSFVHGLTGDFLTVSVLAFDDTSGKWVNDSTIVELDDVAQTAAMSMGVPMRVRAVVEEKDALA